MPSKQASPRGGEGRSVAERMAREIIPQWTNASAANTMEYENALEAQMMEGHGPVEGLLHAVYTGEVNETVDGFLKFQLLKLGGAGSDEEGPNEVDEATMWGADPVAAFEASRRHEVKPEVPSEDSVTMKAHRKMVRDFGKLITKVVRRSVDASDRHALSDMLDVKVNPFPKWGEFFRDQMTPRSVQMIKRCMHQR